MTQYDFRLSLRSNDPKVVFTGKYLAQFDDMRHRILSRMVDAEYVIGLCSDPTKTKQEILIALIESLSNDAARMAYKANHVMAATGIIITPDMLSNFGLLPSIQYSSTVTNDVVDAIAENANGSVPTQFLIVEPPVIPVVENPPENIKDDEEDEDEEDEDDYDNMTDEEYAEAMLKVMEMPTVKS